MKLSSKFFCTAYIIVLLSTGLGGMLIIKNVTDTLWNTQTERVNIAVNYATDSFLAFTDISYNEISESLKKNIIRQILDTLDSTVAYIEIDNSETVNTQYQSLENNTGISQFIVDDGMLLMKSVCKLDTGVGVYYLAVYSDFTDIQRQCDFFWQSYGIVVFGIAAVSGLLLFALTRKITKPLKLLAKAADEIALGNYGEKVSIKSSDYEIADLSGSFNSMSSAIEQKIKEIKEESEKRSMFVADFTHELKTPMTAIIGYSQMLNSYKLEDFEQKEASAAIYNEAKRLEKLSLQLLELYVLQNENVEIKEIRLLPVQDRLKAALKYLSEKCEISLYVNFNNEIVYANETLLLSLIYNLADNAFKASAPQSEVKIYSRPLNDEIQIVVEDKGMGIAKENIEFLTEPFYREDKSRSRKLGGAGIGLSLCKKIAELHGTKLCFESEKGKGTTVAFTLKRVGKNNV